MNEKLLYKSNPLFLFLLFSFLIPSLNLSAQPDLVVVKSTLVNSIRVANLNNPDDCLVEEGCIGGLGPRQLVRFTTHIKNIGNQDFYVGAPPNNPSLQDESWEWDFCHQHWHYEGYADYLIFDQFGNQTPIGVKNGFCLIDIECSGGGTFTYNCGNQGISAGCGDIYGSGLDCQWVDITNLADGIYTLVVRVNWDGSPDANGLYETTYDNNTLNVCFDLTRDLDNNATITILNSGCSTSEDCIETTLTIALDQFPEETSWEIRDGLDNLIAGGNNYDQPGVPSTVSEIICLPEGCYDLIFKDTGSDGICCNFGQGNFQLTDPSGTVLVSGGQFTGEANTTNFCVTGVSPCTDVDGDGICAEDDCNDNDNTLPAPPGVACNDNDPNTENDIIQGDGCSCAGTPITPPGDPCDNIIISTSDNLIQISNIGTNNFPHINIQVFSSTWSQLDICVDDCGNPYQLTDLPAGDYIVSVKPFNAAWQTICEILVTVQVPGDSGPCTDNDGDGICLNDDCDDNNPNLPTTVGSSCDDNNANTENDVILADGCSCAGTVIQTGQCSNINIVAIEGGLDISGIGSFPFVNIQVFNDVWQRVNNCSGTCANPYVLTDLPEGLYHVSVKTFDGSWQTVCDIFEDHYVSGQSGPCTDVDDDGVCAYQDCDDNNPDLPAAPGSSCNDGNPSTTNDMIQQDGCTCQGTLVTPPSDCDAVVISGGQGNITITGLSQYPHSSVQVQTNTWNPIDFCVDNCGDPYIANSLSAGTYLVTIKIYSASWTEICRIDETVEVAANNLGGITQLIDNPFIFEAGAQGTKVDLSWIVTNEHITNRFEVEKSLDGVNFSKLTTVACSGISNNVKTFEGVDTDVRDGIYTYRIKQIFVDGSWRHSEKRKVQLFEINNVNIFPNPTSDEFFIDLSKLDNVEGEIIVSNLYGQELIRQDFDKKAANLIAIDTDNLTAGVYNVYIKIEGRKDIGTKIIVAKQ